MSVYNHQSKLIRTDKQNSSLVGGVNMIALATHRKGQFVVSLSCGTPYGRAENLLASVTANGAGQSYLYDGDGVRVGG